MKVKNQAKQKKKQTCAFYYLTNRENGKMVAKGLKMTMWKGARHSHLYKPVKMVGLNS